MNPAFEDYLTSHTSLAAEQIDSISNAAIPRKLRRNESLLRAGEICRQKIFVVSGMIRTYNISNDGNEHILQFTPENNWTVDAESYDKKIPSLVSIDAVEVSEVLLWNKPDFDRLLATMPALKSFSEKIISRNVYYSRQRILSALSSTPEERYEEFMRTFPDYLSRLSLRMIASYLGMSLKTLTRIRHAQLQR